MIAPWDEGAIDRSLLKAVKTAVAQPLAIARFDGPAAYLLYYSGGFPLYSSLAGSGRPLYAGSAKDVRRRLAEHRSSIRSVPSLASDGPSDAKRFAERCEFPSAGPI